ncbi:hypothetical protein [Streptomyces kebangsaanensis]|uniref:hypothetical protein n=1 Tax=Streptomyces kebangsaanensis TaxID=864058 RepID=UPI000939E88B|nr:hypothetical protein [Streptomyces kebangsaanensis]
MSTNGLVWAVNHAAWCKNAGEFAVLVAIANYVDKDMKGCRATHGTLADTARCNKRTVGTHVRSLADRKVIVPGDAALVSHIRQDIRPDVWDFNGGLPEQPDDLTTGKICQPRQEESSGRDRQKTAERPANFDTTTGKNQQDDRQDLPTEPGSEPGSEPGQEPGTSSAEPPTAQTIVGEWLERCQKRPPSSVIGQVSKHIKTLLAEGIAPDDIRRGIATWMAKGLHPSTLASVVNEVMNAPSAKAQRPSGHTPYQAPTDHSVYQNGFF